MNNGSNGRGPRNPLEAALAAAQAGPGAAVQQQVDPLQIFNQFFNFNVPTLRALQPAVAPCLCGRCQGIGVQLEVRMHFPLIGPPEIITRGDAVKPEVAQTTETEKS